MLVPFFKSVKLQKGGAWDITQAEPISTISINSVASRHFNYTRGVALHPSGNRLFSIAGDGENFVVEVPITTVGDITSVQSVTQQVAIPFLGRFLSFSADGANLYITSAAWDDGLFQYTLSTPWDISTLSLAHQMQTPGEIIFDMFSISPDGTKMFLGMGNTTKSYTLSTPWDISTSTIEHEVSTSDRLSSGIFSHDGKSIIYLHRNTGEIGFKKATLSTPWDISTLSINQAYTKTQGVQGEGMCASPSGKTLYVASTNFVEIVQVQLGRDDWVGTPILVLATSAHTKDTSPTGEAIYSSVYPPDPYPGWLAFDRNPGGLWWASDEGISTPGWVGYRFNQAEEIVAFRYDPKETIRAPRQYKLQVSQDGTTWQTVYSDTNAPKIGWDDGTNSGLIWIPHPIRAKNIRMLISETWTMYEDNGYGENDWFVMGELAFFKRGYEFS